MDIGGTLVKCVYFETQEKDEQKKEESGGEGDAGVKNKDKVEDSEGEATESQRVASMRKFLKSNLTYGSTGIRDKRLEMSQQCIGGETGTLHFIKFATSRMDGFFDMVTKNGLGMFTKVVCATGGGAYKFETDFKEVGRCHGLIFCVV